jgi:ferritin-like protein
MSYFGWDGRVDFDTAYDLLVASDMLKHAGIDEDLLINMNVDEIADYLDTIDEYLYLSMGIIDR